MEDGSNPGTEHHCFQAVGPKWREADMKGKGASVPDRSGTSQGASQGVPLLLTREP